MAELYKILGQANPAAATGVYFYTVPDSRGAIVSCITLVNNAAAAAVVEIHAVNAADGTGAVQKNKVLYVEFTAKDTYIADDVRIALSNEDQLFILCDTANVSVSAFGTEFTQDNVYLP